MEKKSLYWMACLFVLALAAGGRAPAGENILRSGGFEEWTGEACSGWSAIWPNFLISARGAQPCGLHRANSFVQRAGIAALSKEGDEAWRPEWTQGRRSSRTAGFRNARSEDNIREAASRLGGYLGKR